MGLDGEWEWVFTDARCLSLVKEKRYGKQC